MLHLILFGTEGCHLCEEALDRISQALCALGIPATLQQTDIAGDEALLADFGVRIPVLRDVLTGHELEWPFDEAQLARFIGTAAANPRQASA